MKIDEAGMPIREFETAKNRSDSDQKLSGFVLPREDLRETVRKLSELNRFNGLLAVIRQWFVICSAIGIAWVINHWLVFLLAMCVIGTRQQALGVLMHEGAHYRLFPNKKVNDLISDLFCAFWIGSITSRYRHQHNLHHRLILTKEDPELICFQKDPELWLWPKNPLPAIWGFIRDMLGWNVVRTLRVFKDWTPLGNHFSNRKKPPPLKWDERLFLYGFIIILALGLYLTNGWVWFLLFWIIPFSTVFMLLFRFRGIAEHIGTPSEHELNWTRNVLAPWYERLIIAPLNVNYHLDHHLFPSIPQYNLPQLHKRLLENRVYRDLAYNQSSYINLSSGMLADVIKFSLKNLNNPLDFERTRPI